MDRVTTRRPPTHSEPPDSQAPEATAPDAGYEQWIHLGPESVFFYPPGSEKEHLVVDHGIPSVTMHWQVKGKLYDHAADHRQQQGVALDDLGDLLAVVHTHEPTPALENPLNAMHAARVGTR
jgi:hypothetical protein